MHFNVLHKCGKTINLNGTTGVKCKTREGLLTSNSLAMCCNHFLTKDRATSSLTMLSNAGILNIFSNSSISIDSSGVPKE
ncbi:hypothetical protein Hanom_Chr04g00382661 [Helianthus anomalus]